MNKRTTHGTEQNQTEKKLSLTVNAVEIHTSIKYAYHVARDAQDVGRQTILRRYSETTTDRPVEMTIDDELFMTSIKH